MAERMCPRCSCHMRPHCEITNTKVADCRWWRCRNKACAVQLYDAASTRVVEDVTPG
jgi:hypothetical protein